MDNFEKNEPCTRSERELANICEQTFLSLWTYPSLFNDRNLNQNKTGQELCDNFVVFGNSIIIFSDKECAFPCPNDLELGWKRWFKRSISESLKQLLGAEKWIKQFPERIYLDKQCTQKFPLRFPETGKIRFHKIIVASGIAQYCQLFHNDTFINTPKIAPSVKGLQHLDSKENFFKIGNLSPKDGYVHVFTGNTLRFVLQELDTINDFTEYLEKKERFILSGYLHEADGELDLLAYYLSNYTSYGKRYFPVPPKADKIVLPYKINRKVFFGTEEWFQKKKDDRISYGWDGTIEHFSKHLMQNTLVHHFDTEPTELEKALRCYASENRFSRRILGKAVFDLLQLPKEQIRRRYMPSVFQTEVLYVFCVYAPDDHFQTFEQFCEYRKNDLINAMTAAKARLPEYNIIVGLAITHSSSEEGSEDLCYMDTTDWNEEDLKNAKNIQNKFSIFLNPRVGSITESEYRPIKNKEIKPKNKNAKKNKLKHVNASKTSNRPKK